jgi:2-methylcitrate dehydratase PrpD
MAEETLTEKLACYQAGLRLDQIPDTVVHAAKLHILDSLGCLLAGTRLEPGKLAYDFALRMIGYANACSATLFGTNTRVSYLDAVQAMSVAAHCGEMDDIHSGAGTCIGGMVIPALISMAERCGGHGRRFLEAAIVGYETTARIGLAIDAPGLFAGGWWPSTVCGALGVAAGGAKFLEWSAERTANALGVAGLHAGGMITGGNEGATGRHFVFGRAAQNGVAALLAVEQGFTGPRRAFEDPHGFCLTLCKNPRWEHLTPANKFHLPDVAFKPYPCARQLHAGVEALLRLLEEHAITAKMIEKIKLSLPTANARMVNRPLLTNSRAATLGSGQYVMAVTAARGRIDLASFEEEFLRSNEVLALMRRVEVDGDMRLDQHFPKYWPARVTLQLWDDRSLTHEVIIPKGESGNPMTRKEVEEKFLSLAAPVLGKEKAQLVVKEVSSLESRESLLPLSSALSVGV